MIKTKVRLEAIAVILFSSIGLAGFLAGPLISADAHFTGSNMYGDYDYDYHIEVRYDGTYKSHIDGTQYGAIVDEITYQGPEVWDGSYGSPIPYPMVVKFMTSVSLGLCFLSGVISLFGEDKKFRLIGSIIGIIFGITSIVGPLLVLDFGSWFIEHYEAISYTAKYNVAFFFPIIFGGLCLIGSIVMLFVKPLLLVPKDKETIT